MSNNKGKCWTFDEISLKGEALRANISYKDFLLLYETLGFQKEETHQQGKAQEKQKEKTWIERHSLSSSEEEMEEVDEDALSVNSEEKAKVPMQTEQKVWKVQNRSCMRVDFDRIEMVIVHGVGMFVLLI